jgi:hypothetical protein
VTLYHAYKPGTQQPLDQFGLTYKTSAEGHITGFTITCTPSCTNDAPTVRRLLFGDNVQFPFVDQVVSSAMPPRKPLVFEYNVQAPLLYPNDQNIIRKAISPDGNTYVLYPWAQKGPVNGASLSLY